MFWALCVVLVSADCRWILTSIDSIGLIDYCICQMYMGADDVDGIINTRIAFAV